MQALTFCESYGWTVSPWARSTGLAGYRERVNAPLERAESLIRTIPDYPEPGVLFRDITPLLADAAAHRAVIDSMIEPFAGKFDLVAGVEARGFLLAGAIAIAAGVGVVPIRKAGKLPRPAASVSYSLEYGKATIEAHDDMWPGARVLLVDDVLATGGTLVAAHELVSTLGGTVIGTSVLMEISALGGRAVVGDVHAVFTA
ncbi:adenine phosphoribosyltransferase (plasmid) [Coraliomargarita sp. W4R53]